MSQSRSQQLWLQHQMPHLQHQQLQQGLEHNEAARLFSGSPRCSLDCNALSTHLPPLSEQRRASQTTYMTPPMSAHAYYNSYNERRPSHDQTYSTYAVPDMSKMMVNGARRMSRDRASFSDRAYSNDPTQTSPTWSADVSREGSLLPGPPGVARRAKAHVPSACVNCKKKHLACETKRPCNRCVASGKEATCVDVQHKKRGRPRLREEDHEKASNDQAYSTVDPGANSSRSKTYRELRSQPDAMPYALNTPVMMQSFETAPMALLTTNFLVTQYNRAFSDALCLRASVHHQRLEDLILPQDRDKLQRLQASIASELQNVLNSAYRYGLADTMHSTTPAIDRLDVLHATAGFQARSDYFSFRPSQQGPVPAFLISLSLARETGHFLILTLIQNISTVPEYLAPAGMSAVSGIPSPPNSVYCSSRYPRDSPPDAALSYPIAGLPLVYEDATIPHQRLAPSRPGSPPRYIQMAAPAYGTPSTKSHSSANSLSGSDLQRTSPVGGKQDLQHLQLPPIRAGPTSDPNSATAQPTERSSKHQNSTPSPSRGSPHSSKRKRRRRLDIGDVLQ